MRKPARLRPTSSFQSYVYNVALDYGLCDADAGRNFTGYLNYDLPFGHGRAFGKSSGKVVNAILGDWRYDTILSLHSGFPVSMIQFGNDPTGAYFQPRPDCLSPSVATPYKNFAGGGYVWFDPTTMAIPGPGKLGTCGISTERGPGLKQMDMSLSKRFNVKEHQYLELRFDAINSFNTPVFTVAGYATDVLPGDFNAGEVRKRRELHEERPHRSGEHLEGRAQPAIRTEVHVLIRSKHKAGGDGWCRLPPFLFMPEDRSRP